MRQFLLFILLLSVMPVSAFETATPESQGIPSQAILDFVERAEAELDALHSFILLRHGKIVASGWWAPYHADQPHMLYSLSKSFTSTAIGMAVAEGRLSLDDTVISFFPEDLPDDPDPNLKKMRIRDLLAMNSGHQENTSKRIQDVEGKTWVQAFLALPVEHKPGTHFRYNSGASFMLSAILQKVTGETLLQYLTPRLLDPLGITDATWETNPQGIAVGGSGLKVRTEDIARLGQLYLQQGLWDGKRLLTREWVSAASARQTSNGSNPDSDWDQGYGYQFWRCRHNAYRGDGAFGQYCIVIPEHDVVLAITSGVADMQKPLNVVWEVLLPAFSQTTLAEETSARQRLRDKLSSLQLPPVAGEKTSAISATITGHTFECEPNDKGVKTLSFAFDSTQSTITLDTEDGLRIIQCCHGTWQPGSMPFMNSDPEPVAASGAWIAPDLYRVHLDAYETPYRQQLDFKFEDNRVDFVLESNVSFGERRWNGIRAIKR